ncbi:hypothetical protein CAPTEDRAFT_192861 [Capitella teleta]|uniref:CCHC-type domain-containing protein n=1 Tax=Capitella teleta TaxID=283909 RepID=R7U6L9_CAPTE|nr:hypothetical protein CAPTEDRAFT_192861 [Capitella teleta]|eukprot:ELU01990.1 hypothetical protein CAPTEDRAFT_192861 [Capitella teleta]
MGILKMNLKDDEGVEKVISYLSHKLSGAQLNWATIEKEAYAIIYALKKFHAYLWALAKVEPKPPQNPKNYSCYRCGKQGHFARECRTKDTNSLPVQAMQQNASGIRCSRCRRVGHTTKNCRTGPPKYPCYCGAAIEPSTPTPVIVPADIPDVWVTDRIDLQDLARHQKEQFHDAYVEASQETDESPYIVQGSLLYTIAEPSHNAGRYLRLLLPQQFRQEVIDAEVGHAEVGHAAFLKTLSRVQEHYVWPEGDRLQAIRLAERILHEYRSKQKDTYRKQEPVRAKRLPPGTFVSVHILNPRKGEARWQPGYQGFKPTAKDSTCNLKKEVFLQDQREFPDKLAKKMTEDGKNILEIHSAKLKLEVKQMNQTTKTKSRCLRV